MFQGEQLVQHAAESPDVRLVVVGVVLEDLGRHVVRRADARASKIAGPSQKLFYFEIIRSGVIVYRKEKNEKFVQRYESVRKTKNIGRWREGKGREGNKEKNTSQVT